MLEEYQRNGCLNYRVRPLESNSFAQSTHAILRNPLFTCRKRINQADQLANILVKAKSRPMVR